MNVWLPATLLTYWLATGLIILANSHPDIALITQYTNNQLVWFTIVTSALLCVITYWQNLRNLFKKTHVIPVSKNNTSILFSHYADCELHPLKQGRTDGYHYNKILALDLNTKQYRSAAIIQVFLPFSAKIHLLGIPNDDRHIQLKPTKGMEKVNLEGDFAKYFTLYCEKGQQTTARYVLDPKAMGFIADFCTTHNWEIINNELLFIHSTNAIPSAQDPTFMWEDVDSFIDEIKPAIALPLPSETNKHKLPYGYENRNSLQCPICTENMPRHEDYFVCKNHGALMRAKDIRRLRNRTLSMHINNDDLTRTTSIVTCPGCKERMEKVMYNIGLATIDSCDNCGYRWLNSNDIHAIYNRPVTKLNKNSSIHNN